MFHSSAKADHDDTLDDSKPKNKESMDQTVVTFSECRIDNTIGGQSPVVWMASAEEQCISKLFKIILLLKPTLFF